MADEKVKGNGASGNGASGDGGPKAPKNGKKGIGVIVKEEVDAFRTEMPGKVKEQIESVKDPTKTQVFTSIFRHKHDETPRNRALGVLSNVFLHLHPAKINRDAVRYSYTWGMGGITFYLFIVLTFTGVLLMFYYHPAVPQAYLDMKDLRFVVSNGVFLRNMHRVAAHIMVIAVFWHMFHVFYRGGYRPPHEFNWAIGVVLLLLTLLLSYTGYLLPWDQLAFWAITVGTNILSAAPFVGPQLRYLLLGGNLVGENALLRFYVLHCVILPLLAALLIGVHFWRIRKDGGLAKPEDPPGGLAEWGGERRPVFQPLATKTYGLMALTRRPTVSVEARDAGAATSSALPAPSHWPSGPQSVP